MAKIATARLPDAKPEYSAEQMDTLIRILEQIIQQLNFGYENDLKNVTMARAWFIDGWFI